MKVSLKQTWPSHDLHVKAMKLSPAKVSIYVSRSEIKVNQETFEGLMVVVISIDVKVKRNS